MAIGRFNQTYHFIITQLTTILLGIIYLFVITQSTLNQNIIDFLYCSPILLIFIAINYILFWRKREVQAFRCFCLIHLILFLCSAITFFVLYFGVFYKTLQYTTHTTYPCNIIGQMNANLSNNENYSILYVNYIKNGHNMLAYACKSTLFDSSLFSRINPTDFYYFNSKYPCNRNNDSQQNNRFLQQQSQEQLQQNKQSSSSDFYSQKSSTYIELINNQSSFNLSSQKTENIVIYSKSQQQLQFQQQKITKTELQQLEQVQNRLLNSYQSSSSSFMEQNKKQLNKFDSRNIKEIKIQEEDQLMIEQQNQSHEQSDERNIEKKKKNKDRRLEEEKQCIDYYNFSEVKLASWMCLDWDYSYEDMMKLNRCYIKEYDNKKNSLNNNNNDNNVNSFREKANVNSEERQPLKKLNQFVIAQFSDSAVPKKYLYIVIIFAFYPLVISTNLFTALFAQLVLYLYELYLLKSQNNVSLSIINDKNNHQHGAGVVGGVDNDAGIDDVDIDEHHGDNINKINNNDNDCEENINNKKNISNNKNINKNECSTISEKNNNKYILGHFNDESDKESAKQSDYYSPSTIYSNNAIQMQQQQQQQNNNNNNSNNERSKISLNDNDQSDQKSLTQQEIKSIKEKYMRQFSSENNKQSKNNSQSNQNDQLIIQEQDNSKNTIFLQPQNQHLNKNDQNIYNNNTNTENINYNITPPSLPQQSPFMMPIIKNSASINNDEENESNLSSD